MMMRVGYIRGTPGPENQGKNAPGGLKQLDLVGNKVSLASLWAALFWCGSSRSVTGGSSRHSMIQEQDLLRYSRFVVGADVGDYQLENFQ